MRNPTDRSLLGDVSSIAIGRSFMREQLARAADVSHLVPARKSSGLRAMEKTRQEHLEEILALDMSHKKFSHPLYQINLFALPPEILRDLMGIDQSDDGRKFTAEEMMAELKCGHLRENAVHSVADFDAYAPHAAGVPGDRAAVTGMRNALPQATVVEEFRPTLAQAVFGQPHQQFTVPEVWETALRFLREEHIRIMEERHRSGYDSPFDSTGTSFECPTFKVEAYDYDDDRQQPFNFKWRHVEISWYKYLGRGMSANIELSPDLAAQMLAECLLAVEELPAC